MDLGRSEPSSCLLKPSAPFRLQKVDFQMLTLGTGPGEICTVEGKK
jgi:hypothetical protein